MSSAFNTPTATAGVIHQTTAMRQMINPIWTTPHFFMFTYFSHLVALKTSKKTDFQSQVGVHVAFPTIHLVPEFAQLAHPYFQGSTAAWFPVSWVRKQSSAGAPPRRAKSLSLRSAKLTPAGGDLVEPGGTCWNRSECFEAFLHAPIEAKLTLYAHLVSQCKGKSWLVAWFLYLVWFGSEGLAWLALLVACLLASFLAFEGFAWSVIQVVGFWLVSWLVGS